MKYTLVTEQGTRLGIVRTDAQLNQEKESEASLTKLASVLEWLASPVKD